MPPIAPGFPSLKARRLLRLLVRELGYSEALGRSGSHRILTAPGRPRLVFAFHDGDEIGGAMVRRILVKDVGLSIDEAKEVVRRA